MNFQNKGIAIMGGTFDPIHIGHLAIAQEAYEYKGLEKVIFIPTGNPPHKIYNEKTDAKIRLEMVKIAIEDNPIFDYCDYEVEKSGLSYSLETVEYIKTNYKDRTIYFIMGEDSLLSIESWYMYSEFLQKVTLLVSKRSDITNDRLAKKIKELNSQGYNVEELPYNFLDISSSDIRKRIMDGRNPKYFLPQRIYEFIFNKGLYHGNR